MSNMEEQWRGHWEMATVSNILLGGSRSFQFACANFCSEYCEYFQEICIYVYAGHPQVWDPQGNLTLVVYAKNTESKMSPFMASSERPRQDPSLRHLIAFLSFPEQMKLLTMTRAETDLAPLKNQEKSIFGGIQRYSCILSNSAWCSGLLWWLYRTSVIQSQV